MSSEQSGWNSLWTRERNRFIHISSWDRMGLLIILMPYQSYLELGQWLMIMCWFHMSCCRMQWGCSRGTSGGSSPKQTVPLSGHWFARQKPWMYREYLIRTNYTSTCTHPRLGHVSEVVWEVWQAWLKCLRTVETKNRFKMIFSQET